MTHPISFELAKSLKEKGFKDECRGYWGYDSYFKKWSVTYPRTRFRQWYRNEILAPTIAEVIMWLYEKHGIWIYADSHEFGKWCYYYRHNRPHKVSPKITENGQFGLDDFNSPTEAYEAAILYTLNNLI